MRKFIYKMVVVFPPILIAIFRGHTSAFHAWLAFNCHLPFGQTVRQRDKQADRQTNSQTVGDTAWIGFDLSEISAQIDWNYYKSLSISRICIENVNGKFNLI